MAELTYDDFQRRLSIQDVLQDAGYVQNRRDGLRYPSYVRIGSDGQRVHGDKFIVTRNGLCCFRPPEQRNYNVIGFIKAFPEMFAEYRPGMDKDRLVNLVCNRLLNNPVERTMGSYGSNKAKESREQKPFDVYEYDCVAFDRNDWESQKKFYPYFKGRGIDLDTQRVFCDHFFLASRTAKDGKKFTNLAFPLTRPAWPGKDVVGMEERGRCNAEGKAYKGMARGSDSANGLWIARLEDGRSDQGFSHPLSGHNDVYWFESAYDAMAFYQLNHLTLRLEDAVFVSTSGNPSVSHTTAMLKETPDAMHFICFDNDEAGRKFADNFRSIAEKMNIDTERLIPIDNHKDWNDQLLAENELQNQCRR